MIEKNRYKLAEYQITEYEDGVLRWHGHHGLGRERSARCFIFGDILVIGQFSHEEDGFLKREFLDRLKKLPDWNKTKFYCFATELFDVFSSKSLNTDWSGHLASMGSGRAHDGRDLDPGAFRLEKYKVTVSGNGQISWQALEGKDRVSSGQCTIQSGILFIGPKEYEAEGQNRRELLKELNEITPWKRTGIWGHSLTLRLCKSSPETGQNAIGLRDPSRDHRKGADSVPAFWKGGLQTFNKSLWPSLEKPKKRLRPQMHLPSGFKLRKPSWPLQGRRKVGFIPLIPLPLAGLLFGLALGLHSVKEISHRHHSSEEHHHK